VAASNLLLHANAGRVRIREDTAHLLVSFLPRIACPSQAVSGRGSTGVPGSRYASDRSNLVPELRRFSRGAGDSVRHQLTKAVVIFLCMCALSLQAGVAIDPGTSPVSLTSKSYPNHKHLKKLKHHPRPFQVGMASWYGRKFQGRTTASGEKFDMQDFTAAHPNLRLGTYVKITSLNDGRAVVVRINDRGPCVKDRIIDVSANAARALGFQEQGVQQVRLDLVR